MSIFDDSITWERIWSTWKYKVEYSFPELLEPLPLEHIRFEFDHQYRIYGYDWVRSVQLEKRIHEVTSDPTGFLLFGETLNKGTLRTAESLVKAQDDSEFIAAIWIYAFVKDILNNLPIAWRGEGFRILGKIETETLSILNEKNVYWHHAMRSLLPEDYISNSLLEQIKINHYSQVIELVILKAALIRSYFAITLYDSYKNDD